MKKNISKLQLVLTTLFVVSLLVSNVITGKQVLLPFGITMTGAVFLFPITYVLSDLFSEVYGYKWSRFTCYLGFFMNLFMVLVFQLALAAPVPDHFTNQAAFEVVLGNTPRVLIASLLAMLVGDLVNDKVFRRMKAKHPDTHKGFEWRAILSSLCGEIADSMVFMPIAFIGQMPAATLVVMSITQVSIKIAYEIIILPVTKLLVKKVSAYENDNTH